MSIDALQLGAEVVRRAADKGQTVTNFSLQKLAYFCHGWHLAFLNAPLVNERFQAWLLGPLLPTLFHTYKPFSCNPISATHPIVSRQAFLPADSDSAQLIDAVLDTYGEFSSTKLVALSQEAGGPWEQVWLSETKSGTIPDASIKTYFDERAMQLSRMLQSRPALTGWRGDDNNAA